MHRRNPDPVRSARCGCGLALSPALRRARLMRRWGWPRGFVHRGAWFCGVDVALASDAWVASAYAVPPRPRGSPRSAAGQAWLQTLAALRACGAYERGTIARGDGAT